MTLERLLQHSKPWLTTTELAFLLQGSLNSRYSKIKRLIAQGKLLSIRRGLYCLTTALGHVAKPHPFEIAQYIYGPSYISFESALSFHGLIPEAVYTTTSATCKRTNEFSTPLGLFSYQTLPSNGLYTEVDILTKNGHKFFMARPWKAMCDYIYCHKKNWKNYASVLENLRIDAEAMPPLHENTRRLLEEYYHRESVTKFLNDAVMHNEKVLAMNVD